MKHVAHLHHPASGMVLRRLRGTVTACLSLAIVLAVSTAARAQFDIETKLTASFPGQDNRFGWSVATSGATAIIGALHAGRGGAAYLFDVSTGKQRFGLVASDAASNDFFGYSVAISGTTAIVGANRDDDAGDKSGSAYLFDVANGKQLFKLTADDAAEGDEFGRSVGISGNIAIVGAYFDDDAQINSGSAYLFDVTTGNQLLKLTASDAERFDLFGYSVAISGPVAIVGSHPAGTGSNFGSAYVFDADPLSPTFGEQRFKLTASDAAANDLFGRSVAISGNIAIVGAWADVVGHNFGSAYLFDVTTGRQLFKLTAPVGAERDVFGWSVGISGTTAIVGDPSDDEEARNSGSAYLFDVNTGKQLFKHTASDAAEGDSFGWSVAISDSAAIVGAYDDDGAERNTGSAYLFASPAPSSDLTNNGFVDFQDLTILLANWNKPGATLAEGNLVDADSTPVDFADLTVLLAAWTGPGPAGSPEVVLAAEAVPEPSSVLLCLIAALGLSLSRRRNRTNACEIA
jgi:hypothetical protein